MASCAQECTICTTVSGSAAAAAIVAELAGSGAAQHSGLHLSSLLSLNAKEPQARNSRAHTDAVRSFIAASCLVMCMHSVPGRQLARRGRFRPVLVLRVPLLAHPICRYSGHFQALTSVCGPWAQGTWAQRVMPSSHLPSIAACVALIVIASTVQGRSLQQVRACLRQFAAAALSPANTADSLHRHPCCRTLPRSRAMTQDCLVSW